MRPTLALVSCLFSAILAFDARAQVSNTRSLGGHYKLDNPKVNVHAWIAPLWGTPCYAGAVTVNGALNPGESMAICPEAGKKNTYRWANNKGGSGTIEQDANGDLTVTVTGGPNAGKKSRWKRQ